MVKIAIAGGSGNVASEIIDVLVATKKHEILIFSRKDAPSDKPVEGVTWIKPDYDSFEQLTQTLQGVHTLLSFVTEQEGAESPIQKRLITAAVQAGVKRFAPSEWATSTTQHLPWYAYKAEIRRYLAELNKDKKVLEYTLFQPGLFANYFTRPYKSSTYIHQIETPIDFEKRRAILVEDGDEGVITLTTVQDFAAVVARAIEYEGEWPVVSGIRGTTLSVRELIALGEKLRGPFKIERVKASDFEAGTWETSWIPRVDHPSIPPEQVDVFSKLGTKKSPQRDAELLGELPDERPLSSSAEAVELKARLQRLEAFLEQSIHNARGEDIVEPPSSGAPTGRQDAQKPTPPSDTPTAPSQVSERLARKYDDVSRELIAAWPSENDLDTICGLPVGLSTPLYWAICTPYSGITGVEPPSPRDMLQLPPPGSHPVLIARKLLVLGTFLQGVLPSTIRSLGSFEQTYREIMIRVFDRATRLVTTNDELTGSAEGIECIMMEAMYQNYAGNLHRAWQATCRAAAVAQMLGLHRGLSSPSMKFLESETRTRFRPEYICFRLVQMDRYLSLMLGLPQSSLESRFGTIKVAGVEHPMERMERIHCTIAGRILSRTDVEINDLAKVYEIDKLIQEAAAEMPPQWWLVPRFSDSAELLPDTMRIMDQFTHHHLLVRLYLPYMLRSSSDHLYDHCKITALNASREILSRFIIFRTSNPAHFYCRGTDFLAFVATTVMCLAHIDSRNKTPTNLGSPIKFLAHSRPADRGMMERTAEIIESMATASVYSTSSCNADEGEHDGGLAQEGKGLRIHIPYFGTIHFEKGAISKSAQTEVENTGFIDPHRLTEQNWDLQGIDIALFDSLFRGTGIDDDNQHTWIL
ncbi:NmrA-like family-domain-containing protein [Aspergillus pseudodeflectus]|uniref:NmrA-like family-domain-containing protein n=1 Tax=Aspergillus pseudodeflectus TaxID=176178 RepID=A0ABR4KCT1_9EURO